MRRHDVGVTVNAEDAAPLRYVLFPGRHHLLTRFQATYLKALVAGEISDTSGARLVFPEPPPVIFAVTSANHRGTRRNPVAYDRREAAIERFCLLEGLSPYVVPVFDVAPTERFADVTLKAVADVMGASNVLDPSNTVVACSTPEVMDLYGALGFRLAPAELDHPEAPLRPWHVLQLLVAADESWAKLAHPASVELFRRYRLDGYVVSVCTDPVVGSEGGLTDTRNYRTYIASFEEAAERKWAQARAHIRPGRIVDIGCATGAMLEQAAADPELWESDLYGVEIARHLYEECMHKKSQGVFSNPNTFFLQRNILAGPAFPGRSIDTTLTFALTHEIYSYGGGLDALERFADVIFAHTAGGGVWINSDVCGPDEPDRRVRLVLADDDGENPAESTDLTVLDPRAAGYLSRLSTRARFDQFAIDFRSQARVPFLYEVEPDGSIVLALADAMEFLSKKDYVDNWLSECHEQFCALDWHGWTELVQRSGFEVDARSGPWRNEWMVGNRLAPVARLTDLSGTPIEWPVTHLLLVAARPLGS